MYKLVGVDIDGVVADIAGHLIEFAEKMFGCTLSLADLTSENVETCSSLTSNQLAEIFSSSSFFQTIPPYKSVCKSLQRLKECGLRVILITDRFWHSEIQEDTRQWLESNRIPFDGLYFATKSEKVDIAQKLNIKLFIEDQLSNANALAGVCDRVILVNRPYNQGLTEQKVTRVSSLDEAVSILNSVTTNSTNKRSELSKVQSS